MCGYVHADINMNLGGASKVKYKSKSRELKANKAGTPVIKLLHFWRFMNKVALFHSQLCAGFGMWHKKGFTWQKEHK